MGKNSLSKISTPVVLLVDDDEVATQNLIRTLKRHGAEAEFLSASTAERALQIAHDGKPNVAVVDLSIDPGMGPESGLKLLSDLLAIDSTLRALVLTGHGAEEWGLRALQHGAASFLTKPVDVPHLLALIRDGVMFSQLKRSHDELTKSEAQLKNLTGLSSRNAKMQGVIENIAYAATNAQPVLVTGETGVGKGVVAHAIHRASRRSGPFIRFQPSFGGYDLVSSELFGHQKGAFTGAIDNRRGLIEEADQGTLFIDELDELPNETQVLLLNVLQEKTFRRMGSNREQHSDFRLIAATNRAPAEILRSGKLRTDLYHRIAHLTIEIPRLADRPEDIPELAESFLRVVTNRERLAVVGFSEDATSRLLMHRWPGNVRELEAVVEGGAYRANFHGKRLVEAVDLGLGEAGSKAALAPMSFRERVNMFELQLVKEALAKQNNNQSRAAESLQLDRTVLRRILEREKS